MENIIIQESKTLKQHLIEYLSNIDYTDDIDDPLMFVSRRCCVDDIEFIRKGKVYTANCGVYNMEDLEVYELLNIFVRVTGSEV